MVLPTPGGRSQPAAARNSSKSAVAAAAAPAAGAGANPADSGLTGGAAADDGGENRDGANSQPNALQPGADAAGPSSPGAQTRKRKAAGEPIFCAQIDGWPLLWDAHHAQQNIHNLFQILQLQPRSRRTRRTLLQDARRVQQPLLIHIHSLPIQILQKGPRSRWTRRRRRCCWG